MIDIISALDDPALFAPWFPGATWNAWRASGRLAGAPLQRSRSPAGSGCETPRIHVRSSVVI